MHALEVAKVAWNGFITIEQESEKSRDYLNAADWYLRSAARVLETFGHEGDEGGPLKEVEVLENLIRENMSSADS